MRNLILASSLLLCASVCAQNYDLSSPDGHLKITVNTVNQLKFSVSYKDRSILKDSEIGMVIHDLAVLGESPQVRKKTSNSVSEMVKPVVAQKSAEIPDHYHEMTLEFKGSYRVTFRAYNDGVAYRFSTSLKKDIQVDQETFKLNFAEETTSLFPLEESLISHYERLYIPIKPDTLKPSEFCSLPVLMNTSGVNIVVTESDLYDYPGMFMKGTNSNALEAMFPPYVTEAKPVKNYPDRNQTLTTADYIAKTSGARNFPWRIMIISEDDRKLVESQLPFLLARPTESKNTDWIKPGKVAWDWYNANNIYGVDFVAGINTDTYKYYIDFAAKYGLEYVILDEGWTKTTTNIRECNPDIDVKELVRYGREKNVGIILWLLWGPLDKDISALELYKEWGVKGVKVDFMQRADQGMVNYYEKVAKAAFEKELLVDYHGAFKPSGLRRKYPNVINYEGVKGNENNKWTNIITPEHDLTLPFTRMVAGPMDYTPGAMSNGTAQNHVISFNRPMSVGTRCHEMAMYVVFEGPLQMLCDAPSAYYKEPELTSLISRIPTVWDETKVLEAKIGDYLVIARRNGDTWYLGAMTDWTPREFEVDLSFLNGGNYQIEDLQDGINAHRYAEDFRYEKVDLDTDKPLKLKLASGGGFVAIISKK